MVKVVFIVEGKVEQIFIDFLYTKNWLSDKGIEKVGPTIDVRGGGNLCPKNMQTYVEQARIFNPEKIFILTDLECDPCVEKTKERLGDCDICTIVLAKKAIEAWFLADNDLLKILTDFKVEYYANPEETDLMPYETYKELLIEKTGRGTGSKVSFVKKIFKRYDFSIEKAAEHPNCQSARYFVDQITNLGLST